MNTKAFENYNYKLKPYTFIAGISLVSFMNCQVALAEKSVTFSDVANLPESNIEYERQPSLIDEKLNQLKLQPLLFGPTEPNSTINISKLPIETRGWPGVAVFDYDKDGDMDLYITNGPGVSNSLYSNQLMESGDLGFFDQGADSGVGAVNQDSSGVCYGDIDNDGDQDLMVLGMGDSNILYENNGDGSFINITEKAGISGGELNSTGCSMGDVNGDGLLDIVVANSLPINDSVAWWLEPFSLNQHNQLYLNSSANVFTDISEQSGIKELAGLEQAYDKPASVTFAIAMVDYDLDGDLDIVTANDNGFFLPAALGGIDRGIIHIFKNDGNASFVDVSVEAKTNVVGAWMGLSFADFNSDGLMDIFATNAGDFESAGFRQSIDMPYVLGDFASRWFLGQSDGSFLSPGVGDVIATPFAWGTVAEDYNNDGDTDILFYGGMDIILSTTASNPGVLLQNDGNANFHYDKNALTKDHSTRSIHGVASGDLNNDGYVDIISVSGFDHPEPIEVFPIGVSFGSELDIFANLIPMFVPGDKPNELIWSGITYPNGGLAVEINNAESSNNWVKVELLGTKSLTDYGQVNRDGIGAVIKFTPENGKTVMKPVIGGASHLSQNSLVQNFGLGSATEGTIEVIWPGGIHNKLYSVNHGELVTMPEIPCDYRTDFSHHKKYRKCLSKQLKQLYKSKLISRHQLKMLTNSAIRAHIEYNKNM